MDANIEITQGNELRIHVSLPENEQLVSSPQLNMFVENIEIFNTRSFLDGIVVYTSEIDIRTTESHGNLFYQYNDDFTEFDMILSDHEINVFEQASNTDDENRCYYTDLKNDIITVNITVGHSDLYEVQQSCCGNTSGLKTCVTYDQCPIYDNAVQSLGGCNCRDMCEDNLPYGFMYALLKKSAIDACLRAGHIDMACRYYLKFFRRDSCNCIQKDCGCSKQAKQESKQSIVKQQKNCGCHG